MEFFVIALAVLTQAKTFQKRRAKSAKLVDFLDIYSFQGRKQSLKSFKRQPLRFQLLCISLGFPLHIYGRFRAELFLLANVVLS